MTETARPSSPYAWFPRALLIALGLVVAVNGAFVYFAISSWPGLVTDRPFEEGQRYNHVLGEATAQAALGWKARLSYDDGRVVAHYLDRNGAPLDGLEVTARLSRPLGDGAPLALTLAPAGPGLYAAAVALPAPGQWTLRAEARQAGDKYDAATRIIAP